VRGAHVGALEKHLAKYLAQIGLTGLAQPAKMPSHTPLVTSGDAAVPLATTGHAVVVLDRAGWHTTGTLHAAAQSPEPNSTENLRQFLRQSKLSNRISGDYRAIVTAACETWDTLTADPARVTSIRTRQPATIKRNYGPAVEAL
jgi:hypothetical protein